MPIKRSTTLPFGWTVIIAASSCSATISLTWRCVELISVSPLSILVFAFTAPQAVRSERLLARGASRDKRFSERPHRTAGDFEAGDDLTEMIARKDGPQELGRESFVRGATSLPVSSRTEGERYPEQADESTHTQGKDNPDTIRTRQAAYQAREDSLIEYLQLRLLVTKVDASLCVEDVFRAVCDAFESRQQQPQVQEGVAFSATQETANMTAR